MWLEWWVNMGSRRQYNAVFTVSNTWNVQHGLDREVLTEIFILDPNDSSKYVSMLPSSVIKLDNNNIRVTFTSPTAGKIRCI